VIGDREAQDHISEEGEALVGLRAVLGPGGVGEGLAREVRGQLIEQVAKRRDAVSGRSATGSVIR